MREWQSQSHVRWYGRDHVVWVPKYRKRAIFGEMRRGVGRIVRELCQRHGVELVEGHARSDHVHVLLGIPPKCECGEHGGVLEREVLLRPRVFLDTSLRESISQEAARDFTGSTLWASVAPGVAAGRGRGGRFSADYKREAVRRLLRGEDLESVSRAVGITAARASHWRAQFLAAGQAGRKSRAPDARDETIVGCRPRSASC